MEEWWRLHGALGQHWMAACIMAMMDVYDHGNSEGSGQHITYVRAVVGLLNTGYSFSVSWSSPKPVSYNYDDGY